MTRSKVIGKKIGILKREGKPAKQAAAIAYDMQRRGKLRPDGSYKRSLRDVGGKSLK